MAKKTLSRLSRCHTYEVSGFSQLEKFYCLTGQSFSGSYPLFYRQLSGIGNTITETDIVK